MASYNPQVFLTANIDAAKSIILTNEGQVSTEQRWESETPYLCEVLLSKCAISNQAQILDFGCGIGRMSRALLERTDSSLWGADFSPTMRKQALDYVDSERFTTLSPQALDAATRNGMRFDLALSVWVLQHCPNLDAEIKRLFLSLRTGGVLFVVDMNHRAIPTHDAGWLDDGKSVKQSLLTHFALLEEMRFAAPHSPTNLQQIAWIGLFQKKE
jgi:cyclopropane fatty-acyl-phospholipid synthase-like methyltransferase